MSNPNISVIIPVFNVKNYLDRCIKSLINQNYSCFEIILVDDGSTDGSSVLCDRWAENDTRIRVLHKENGGLADARNIGVMMAKGEYIIFVDSDDYVDNGYISSLWNLKTKENADISCTPLIYEFENGTKKPQSIFKERIINKEQAKSMIMRARYSIGVTACSKLFPKKVLLENQFPIGELHEDLAVMIKIFDNFNNVVISPFASYHYVQRRTSITHQDIDFDSLFSALDLVKAQIIQNHNVEFVRACVYRMYDLVTEITRVASVDQKREIIAVQDYIRKYRKIYLEDPENSIITKIKGIFLTYSFFSFIFFCKIKHFKERIHL